MMQLINDHLEDAMEPSGGSTDKIRVINEEFLQTSQVTFTGLLTAHANVECSRNNDNINTTSLILLEAASILIEQILNPIKIALIFCMHWACISAICDDDFPYFCNLLTLATVAVVIRNNSPPTCG